RLRSAAGPGSAAATRGFQPEHSTSTPYCGSLAAGRLARFASITCLTPDAAKGYARRLRPTRGAQALHHGRPGILDEAILVGDHPEPAAGGKLEQLSRPQQEIGIRGPAVTLVACGKRFVNQHAACGERREQMRKQRTVQVVGYHDTGEALAR